jgi:hypothetical protein
MIELARLKPGTILHHANNQIVFRRYRKKLCEPHFSAVHVSVALSRGSPDTCDHIYGLHE